MLMGEQDELGQAKQEIIRLHEQVIKHVRSSLWGYVIPCDLQSLRSLFVGR